MSLTERANRSYKPNIDVVRSFHQSVRNIVELAHDPKFKELNKTKSLNVIVLPDNPETAWITQPGQSVIELSSKGNIATVKNFTREGIETVESTNFLEDKEEHNRYPHAVIEMTEARGTVYPKQPDITEIKGYNLDNDKVELPSQYVQLQDYISGFSALVYSFTHIR